MHRWTWIRALVFLLFLLPLSFGGCEVSCETNETPVEEAGEELEDAAEETGEALEDIGEGS